jgi:MYXO-CTERM domain-containing protein
MSKFLAAVALAATMTVLSATSASAVTRSFEAIFNLAQDNSVVASSLAVLGETGATNVIFRWSYDTLASPLYGPLTVNDAFALEDRVNLRYSSFSMTVGSSVFNAAPSTSAFNSLLIIDGIAENGPFPIYASDVYELESQTDIAGPNNTLLTFMRMTFMDGDESAFGRSAADPAFSGLNPTVEELNSMGGAARFLVEFRNDQAGGRYRLTGQGGSVVETTNLAAVPIPPAAPLMLAGLGLLWFVRRRQIA